MSKAEQTTQMNYELRPVREGFALDGANIDAARTKLLLDFNKALVAQLDLDGLLKLIFSSVREIFEQTVAATLAIHDVEKDELRIHLLHSEDPDLFHEGMPLAREGTPSGLAFTTRQTVLIHRLVHQDFPTTLIERALADGIKSACSVPLISHDRVVGALTVAAATEAAYRTADAELLTLIGAQMSMSIENALNFRAAQRERDRKRLLLEITNAVVSHLDLKELVKTVSATLRDMLPHEAAGIALYEPEQNQLVEYTNVNYMDVEAFKVGDTIAIDGTPAGQVFVTGKPLLVRSPNLTDYPADRYSQNPVDGSPKSACLAPLITHGRKLGIVGVSSTEENRFTEEDLELFNQIAPQIAIAVQNTLNYERASRERARAQILLEINNAITTNLELGELIHALSVSLHEYFKHDFAAMSLYDEDTNELMVHSLDSLKSDVFLLEGAHFPIEGTLNGLAFSSRQPLVRNRLDPSESSWPLAKQFFEEQGLKSACFIPMISGGRTVGVLNLGSKKEGVFSQENVELLTHIGAQIAIAVQNSLNFDRATKAKERMQILLEANNAVATSLNLRDLLKTTSACLRTYFDHDVAGLSLYDESKQKLIVHAMDRHDQFTREGTALPLEGSPVAVAFAEGRPVLWGKFNFKEFSAPEMDVAYNEGWRSGCSVPLLAHDRKLGCLGLVSFRDDAFDQADAALLLSIAGQVALAVENTLQFREIELLKNKLASEKLYLEEEIKTQYNFAEIVGESSRLSEVLRQVETVAPTDSTVLLIGETGTGKELIARAIHNLSSRGERTLVKLNCAAIPTGLLESELFGHEKGAFTGAIAQRVGRFELAHKGTLLLDEIGEIPLELQPKLLRVLQEHEFERLGSSRTVKTDARLIAATNCDLAQMVEEKKFRSDLFYRLNVFPIVIPPLRERTGDIPLLVGYFAQKHGGRMNKKIETIPTATMQALCDYPWPGNVRELENFIERSVILSRDSELQSPLAELRANGEIQTDDRVAQRKPGLTTMDEMERAYIEEVLRHTNGSIGGKDGAAEILGMPASTLRGRMKKLGIR
jgi:formate hydrogenlyase transcriptional activator